MKKRTKLLAFLLIFSTFAFFSFVVADPVVGYPYEFRVGEDVLLVGEFFDIEGPTFYQLEADVYVILDETDYVIEAESYIIRGNPYQVTLRVFSDYDCYFDGNENVCMVDEGSGGGGGM